MKDHIKNISFLLLLIISFKGFSQCFDCGFSIGGHVEDYIVDIDEATDGIVLTYNLDQGWARSIYKYDFNCNLMWSTDLLADDGFSNFNIGLEDTTIDDNNNIYTIIKKRSGGSTSIQGFTFERGNSLMKLDSSGAIEWVYKISDEDHLKRKVHFWMGNVYVVGELDDGTYNINNHIQLDVPDGFGIQYFAAKFDASGNLIDSKLYGTDKDENFFDSQIDENGNIYFTGTIFYSSNHSSELNKIDSNLNLVWTRQLSNNPAGESFKPMTIHYNNTNEKLYVWSKYYVNTNFYNNNITVSNNCNTGSIIMEVSKNTGDLENYKVIDNCGFLHPVGNGIGDVEQRSFMAHEGSNLFILSSFRGGLTIGNETITSSQTIYNEYNSDLVLYKIDLNDFSAQLLLRSQGENIYPTYRDLAGPIIAVENSVYITSSFTSKSITIDGNSIINNSGNNARDILFYKHNLDQNSAYNSIAYNYTCFNETTEFLIDGDFDSILWNFDDPPSGTNNNSMLSNPSHAFTSSGTYDVSVTVTCDGESQTIIKEVIISEPPYANQIDNLPGCEDSFNLGFSSFFDSSTIESQVLGTQTNMTILYFDGNGNELPSPIPNPMTNSIANTETITVRVSNENNPGCYAETTFELIVQSIPEVYTVDDLFECDNNTDGFADFDLSDVESIVLGGLAGMTVEYYDGNGNQIPKPLPNPYLNSIPIQEIITVRVINDVTDCYNETTFTLNVNELPIANSLDTLIGCDDDNDGISEYFDTTNIESQILDSQTGMEVSYFDSFGNVLPNPLPNPLTNTEPNTQNITVRVTNSQTGCYSETTLILETAIQPNINEPDNLYACDEGNGFAHFDTSDIELVLIGSQVGLDVFYFDDNGNTLPSPLPSSFLNTTLHNQTISVRVENILNRLCYSETSFDLIVNESPEINLEEEYLICNLNPSLELSVALGYYSYAWYYGTELFSETDEAILFEEGNYTLVVTELMNGIECENAFDFTLSRSVLPEIIKVEYDELGTNFIRILVSGDGDFEYSIDGVNYQDSNYFNNISGGIYTAYVRDKYGCGEDTKEITLIDYPKFFTPNNDGYKDTWQIYGIRSYSNSKIFIYDRYGKLLKQLNPNGIGWDGTFNGKPLNSNDFWFTVDLNNGKTFKGHFTLKR